MGKANKADSEKKTAGIGHESPVIKSAASIAKTKKSGSKPASANPAQKQPPLKNNAKNISAEKPASTYIHDRFYEKLPFFKRLNARRFLTLDIDPGKINYVTGLRSGDEIQVEKWGVQKYPSEEKDRKKALQISLENIRSKIYKRGMEIAIGIFNPELNIRQVIIPKLKKESDLRQALDYKNQADLQNYDKNSIWSYEILDEFEKEGTDYYKVLVTVAPEEVINEYIAVFDSLKMEINQIIPRPAAIQAAYRKMVFRPGRDLLINVSYDLTQICYLRAGYIDFIRNVSIGSRNLEVSIHTPRERKDRKNDIEQNTASAGNSSLLRGRLQKKIQDLKNKQNPILHTFFSEILRSLAYIQGRNVKQYIERIFITGYGIRKESLMPYLRSRLNMPVFILTPQLEQRPNRTLEFGEYYTAIGNILQQNRAFNILPKNYKNRLLFKKLNYFLSFVMVALILIFGYISVEQARIIHQKETLIEQYNQEYQKLNPYEGIYKDIKKQIADVNQKNKELHNFVKKRPPVIKVMRFFSNETPSNIRLKRLKFSKMSNDQSIKAMGGKTFDTAYAYQIDLSGIIRSDPLMGDVTLINYINRLIAIKFFKRVELLNKLKDPGAKIITFDMRLYL